jgi:uncharacterized protein (DUF1697 family)
VATTAYVALLRAVNLGAHNKVAMGDLCTLFSTLGLEAPTPLLQSGNVIFRSARRDGAALETCLESALATQIGLRTDVFVRSASEWRTVVAGNPFTEQTGTAPNHVLVMCLKTAPGRAGETALRTAIVGREEVHLARRHLYAVYPDGIGRSRLSTSVIERALGTTGTARNWNTVVKIDALLYR